MQREYTVRVTRGVGADTPQEELEEGIWELGLSLRGGTTSAQEGVR
jgi:hypothetical protein